MHDAAARHDVVALETGGSTRRSGPFVTPRQRNRYLAVMGGLLVVCLASTAGVMAYDNPMPVGSDGFWRIVDLRMNSLFVILVASFCHAFATVSFQTATANRIITPSIMGFEALYVVFQTGAVYLFGVAGITMITGTTQFLLQALLMVLAATALYTWLLSGRFGDVHTMLLVGVIIGGGLGSLSTFLQRLLTPSEFDILAARLFGNISTAEDSYLPFAVPIALLAGGTLYARSHRLNLLALGPEAATNLGIDHQRELKLILFLVSVLMAMTTAMVGPMTFLGFLVAMLAYQFADTYDHRLVLPMAFLIGYAVLSTAYFVLRHVFYAQGRVTIIIEVIGGVTFLVHIMRKGRL